MAVGYIVSGARDRGVTAGTPAPARARASHAQVPSISSGSPAGVACCQSLDVFLPVRRFTSAIQMAPSRPESEGLMKREDSTIAMDLPHHAQQRSALLSWHRTRRLL